MRPSSSSSTGPSPAPTPSKPLRPPFQLRSSSATRKASNPSLSLVYASSGSSLPPPPAFSSSSSSSTPRSEEALSRQLDAGLGGRQMGLRSRRSSSATLRTINTMGNGGEGSRSPRESIAELDEDEEMGTASGSGTVVETGGLGVIHMEPKGQEEGRTRLNPKSSSSWLRWNSPTPSFPKGKGKGKEWADGDRTPVRPASTIGNQADEGEGRPAYDTSGEIARPSASDPPMLDPPITIPMSDTLELPDNPDTPIPKADDAQSTVSVPAPTTSKSRGWFSKNPAPVPLPRTMETPSLAPRSPAEAVSTTSDATFRADKQEAGPATSSVLAKDDPVETTSASEAPEGLQAITTEASSAEETKRPDRSVASELQGAGGWKDYLTWGRKEAPRRRTPIPKIEPAATSAMTSSVEDTQDPVVTDDFPTPEQTSQIADPVAEPLVASVEVTEPASDVSDSDPIPAMVDTTKQSDAAENPQKTWGSFLYGIVIPQIKEQGREPATSLDQTSAVVTSDPTAEQPAIPAEDLVTAEEETLTSVAPVTSSIAPSQAEQEGATLQPGPASRKGSEASTAGWLSYLAFRASQRRVENIAPSVATADNEEVMDLSNDPNFPSEPTPITTLPIKAATPSNLVPTQKAVKGAMKPPATIPDKKKRLSTSSLRSATSVTPIPPSPQSQARPGTGTPSIAPSQKASSALPAPPQASTIQPNLVMPSFATTFDRPPRSVLPPKPASPAPTPPTGLAWRALGAVGSYVYPATPEAKPADAVAEGTRETRGLKEGRQIGHDLPRRIGLAGEHSDDGWKNVKRVVVVGVHGWFPAKMLNSVIGEPTGTSSKFANMMGQAVKKFFDDKGVDDIRLTLIPLEGEGTIEHRVDRLYKSYLSNPAWINDLRRADAVFFAAHSQGCIVTTHLLSRLIAQGHLKTPLNAEAVARCSWAFGPVSIVPPSEPRSPSARSRQANTVPVNVEEGGYQKVCMLSMCGVHQGPLYSLGTSTVIQPYLHWFENPAARELFEFQETITAVSQAYQRALAMVLENGVRVVLLSSLNDQVVPIYGSSFSAASHPLLLRALFVDGASYSASDFMTNLLCFAFMLRNAGISDQHLIEHLSEATAGSLTGLGHSTPYEESASYALAVDYLFYAASPPDGLAELQVEHFSAREGRNDFELPWIMRALVDSPEVKDLFPGELRDLKEGIIHWKPVTKALKDIKKKLEPMAGRQSKLAMLQSSSSSTSLASAGEPGSSPGNRLLAPSAGLRRDW